MAHPLDPLTSDEIRSTVEVLGREKDVDERWRFATIMLREPPKAELAAWSPGTPHRRESEVILWDRADGLAYEAVVDLDAGALVTWSERKGVQPCFTHDEFYEADAMLRAHPEVVAALARHGIDDPALVLFDTWAYGGALVPERYRGRRIGWTDVWVRDAPDSNPYAHFVGGFHCIVDLNSMELLEIEDDAPPGRPATMGEYVPAHVPGLTLRDDLKPLEISQPNGVSFRLDGHELSWQRWSLRLGFNGREGLVFHQVGYEDAGRVRSIANRISFAEMIVPYRDPTADHYRRTAFDIGEWGLGFAVTSLELGCDCLGEIVYLDAVLHDSRGEPTVVKNAVCIHEEDNAVLWKHVDSVAGAEVRRVRRLVVSFHATVANYEYLVYWRFYQDGSIECEVRATGIMVTTGFDGAPPPFGTVVDKSTYAPFHQHFLVARLDLDVDGPANTVVETESAVLPTGPDNPHGLAVVTRGTAILSERDGQRDYDWATQRGWKVQSAARKNAHGDPVAYKLVPTACVPPMLAEDSPLLRRSQVIGHQLWVTQFHDDERWPAGTYPTQSVDDDGLPIWMGDDRSLENEDVVLWYVFGIHHITRVEDWPVMPADTVSFWLKPFGFFDRNPALDVAPTAGRCH